MIFDFLISLVAGSIMGIVMLLVLTRNDKSPPRTCLLTLMTIAAGLDLLAIALMVFP